MTAPTMQRGQGPLEPDAHRPPRSHDTHASQEDAMADNGNTAGAPKARDSAAYEEIHAAIQELYRLMGVPRSAPPAAAGAYDPGYLVYARPEAAAYATGWPAAPPYVAPGAHPGSPYGPVVNQQPMLQPPHAMSMGPGAADPRWAAWGHAPLF